MVPGVRAGDVAATGTDEGRIGPYAAAAGIADCLCCVVWERYW